MGLDNVGLNNVCLDDINFDYDYPKTIIHVKLVA